MPTEVDWSSFNTNTSSKKSSDKKSLYFKVNSGEKKLFRPVGKAQQFTTFFIKNGNTNRSVTVEPGSEADAAAILSQHLGSEVKPSVRFAINVIDRDDNNIKILEGGTQIFSFFAQWSQEMQGQAPGGKNGYDWSIRAEGSGMNKKYTLIPVKSSPLTDQEVQRIKQNNELHDLKEKYAGIPLNEIVEKVFGEKSNSSADSESDSELDSQDF